MTNAEFSALVEKLERLPASRYRMRLRALAVLGYIFIFAVLLIAISLLAGIVFMIGTGHWSFVLAKPAILLAVFVLAILKSLWVSFPQPTGVPVGRDQAPELYGMLDTVSDTLAAPRFHHVLMVDDFNAGVIQVPRLGIFGWQANYLLLGLPLMQATSPERFEAIVAHELGHLSGNHSRFGGWIYRIRTTYLQVLSSLRKSHGFNIFASFFKWYAPYFQAYSFVLARANEYEADRCAADVAGAKTAAEALIEIGVRGRLFQRSFMEPLASRALVEREPPATAFVAFGDIARERIGSGKHARWLAEAAQEARDPTDTHPSLAERLAALGFTLKASDPGGLAPISLDPGPLARTAVDAYMPGFGPAQLAAVGDFWRLSVYAQWQKMYAQGEAGKKRLEELDGREHTLGLTENEQLERVQIAARLRGKPEAIGLMRRFLESHPDNASARAYLGQMLLSIDDATGIAEFEAAMRKAPRLTVAGSEAIAEYLSDRGRTDEAATYRRQADERRAKETAVKPRLELVRGESFLPAGAPADVVGSLASLMEPLGVIVEAYLVRKPVDYVDGEPIYVLALLPIPMGSLHLSQREYDALKNQVVKRITEGRTLDGACVIICYLDGDKTWMIPSLRAVEGALIYRRTTPPVMPGW